MLAASSSGRDSGCIELLYRSTWLLDWRSLDHCNQLASNVATRTAFNEITPLEHFIRGTGTDSELERQTFEEFRQLYDISLGVRDGVHSGHRPCLTA